MDTVRIALAALSLCTLLGACDDTKDNKTVEPAEAERSIIFSGLNWTVKTTLPDTGGPGPNRFSNSENNVWLDSGGSLHLRIEKRRGTWYVAEVWTEEALGYGEYNFLLSGAVDQIDENAVLGLFTWDDAAAENHREIDIELSRWGDPNNENSQFVVQPFDTEGNIQRFQSDLTGTTSRYRFDWQANQIGFQAQQGQSDAPDAADIIDAWDYAGGDIPTPGNAQTHINFWLYGGNSPSGGEAVEVVINEFRHVP